MKKEEVIKEFGRADGLDHVRYEQAVYCAGITDMPVWKAFKSLMNLEVAGYLKPNEELREQAWNTI